MYLQQPVERILGSSFGESSSSRHRFKLKSDCAYDIPLKESLQQLLSNDLVFKEVNYYNYKQTVHNALFCINFNC